MTVDLSALPVARPVGNVSCGTCGWTDPALGRETGFYPPGVSTAEARLRWYASRFPLVEVDSTFYAPPTAENARRWAARTPPGFVMNVKAHGLLTLHSGATSMLPAALRDLLPAPLAGRERVYLRSLGVRAVDALWALHGAALGPLAEAGRLGAVLFQFPSWFTCSARHRAYLEQVAERLPYRIAVEFRGGGWMEPERRQETLALLERLGFTYVVVDGPQGLRGSTPPVVARTAPLAMLRFLGRNAAAFAAPRPCAAARFDYLYTREELAPWAGVVRALSSRSESVHALWNNCHRDYAVRNALDMVALVAQEPAREAPHA